MTIWRNVKKYKTEESSLNLNKDRRGRKRTEKRIEDPRISARRIGLDISKSTFNRITKRDSKWHPFKMHVRKEISNYK